MTREFPDELLSAFLDDELTPNEREVVERHLSATPADRQLVAELKSLRSELGELPRVIARPDFSDRVVRAAMAAKATADASATRPSIVRRHPRLLAVVGSMGAALAACLLLIVQAWRRDGGSTTTANSGGPSVEAAVAAIQSPMDPLLAALESAFPAEGQAVVLRLRLSKDVPIGAALDQALAQAGIQARLGTDLSTGATSLVTAYRQKAEEAIAASAASTPAQTIGAADAIFIEAPVHKLHEALSALAKNLSKPPLVETECHLPYIPGSGRVAVAEGESGSATGTVGPAAGQPFAQRLPAALFQLQKQATKAVAAVAGGVKSPVLASMDRPVRVLILVEQGE
jgi:anti-sigma factor RsiW